MNIFLVTLAIIGYASCQSDLPAPQKNGSVLLQPPHHVPLPRLARGVGVVPFPNGSEPPHGTHPPPPVPLTLRQSALPAPQENGSVLLQPPHVVPLPRLARDVAVAPFPNGSEPPHGTNPPPPAPVPLSRRQSDLPAPQENGSVLLQPPFHVPLPPRIPIHPIGPGGPLPLPSPRLARNVAPKPVGPGGPLPLPPSTRLARSVPEQPVGPGGPLPLPNPLPVGPEPGRPPITDSPPPATN